MVKIAPPPSMSGLVRMVYWPCEHALACPGAGGRLTLYDLEKRAVVETSAHQGDFYAISVLGKKLFTVGFKESQLKTWDGGLEDPTYSLRAPTGVISAGVGGCPPAEILLIEARGAASAWTLQAGKLRLARQHAGQDYRAVCCPRADRVQIVYAQQRREEVQRIVTKIGEHSAQADADNTEELHARLIDLNCEHVSLALRADQAYQRGNIVQALTLYSSLIRILPTDDPNACASMERYAAMLAKAWQIPEAAQILTRIQKLDPDYQLTAQTENLVHLAKILRDRHWVINPGMPIEDIIQSATAIGRGFIGRYVINKGHPQGCGSTQLEAAEIAEKYEQARRESGETSLPPAGAERVWWLSEMQVQKMDLVSFGEGRTNPIRGLQLALQVLTTASKTTVILTVLFDWRDASKAVDLEAQNDQAHNALTQIRNRTLSNSYLGGIHKTLQHCLRRLLTERSSYQGAS
ncbi:MAG: hypothetical protein SWH78_12775 [Thermodesulfobacteriota bacterium]|nr:hypothetical protein [Thermodesulfobacteriota bacterium]